MAEYLPGQFYLRELPCILNLLREHDLHLNALLIDGYVFLDGISRAGLGKYLFDAFGENVPLIGVAKTSFADIGPEFRLFRGDSKKPLFITSAGVEVVMLAGLLSAGLIYYRDWQGIWLDCQVVTAKKFPMRN